MLKVGHKVGTMKHSRNERCGELPVRAQTARHVCGVQLRGRRDEAIGRKGKFEFLCDMQTAARSRLV